MRRAGRATHTMAGGSATEVGRRTTARILIAVGLMGCIWALFGYHRVKTTPVILSTSATPALARMDSSSATERNATSGHTLSGATRFAATPPSSPAARVTDMPVSSPSLTTWITRTSVPPVEPTPSVIVALSEQSTPWEGVLAPDFTLPNAQGGSFTLSDLRDQRGVVLVFYRTTG